MSHDDADFTLSQLVELINQEYPGLTEGALRVLISRGQFPRPFSGSGTRSDPYRWNSTALQLLCDRRFVQLRKNRSTAIELGLWLHGHDVDGAGDLLADQIDEVEKLLIGRTISRSSELSECEREAVNDAITLAIDECEVLPDLVRGNYPSLIADRWEEYEAMADAEVSAKVLKSFPYPRTDPTDPSQVIYPVPTIPVRVRRMMEEDAVRSSLEVMLNLIKPWEGGPYWSLPRLASLLRVASNEALKSARWSAQVDLIELIRDSDSRLRQIPNFAALDVPHLERVCRGDIRHLFGDPALFPLMALLIGTSLHDQSSPHHVTRNQYMLPTAIKRLLEEPQRKAKKRDAVLTLLFSFDPKYQANPEAVEALRKTMRRKGAASSA